MHTSGYSEVPQVDKWVSVYGKERERQKERNTATQVTNFHRHVRMSIWKNKEKRKKKHESFYWIKRWKKFWKLRVYFKWLSSWCRQKSRQKLVNVTARKEEIEFCFLEKVSLPSGSSFRSCTGKFKPWRCFAHVFCLCTRTVARMLIKPNLGKEAFWYISLSRQELTDCTSLLSEY